MTRTAHTVPVAVYVTVPHDHDPIPLLQICRSHAHENGWRVAFEDVDTLPPDGIPRPRRPGWARTKRTIIEGWARGLLTYAPPMLGIGDHYTDVEIWAQHRQCFLAAAWQPADRQLVLDTISRRTGILMARTGRAVMLRPERGGREWSTPATALAPLCYPSAIPR